MERTPGEAQGAELPLKLLLQSEMRNYVSTNANFINKKTTARVMPRDVEETDKPTMLSINNLTKQLLFTGACEVITIQHSFRIRLKVRF